MPSTTWPAHLALGLALLVLLPGGARGQSEEEEILDFDVHIQLEDGGVMTVTETIRVRALQQEIRRGIFRDIPTRFPRATGLGTVVAPLDVLEVTRDGRPEPYRVETVEGPDGRSGVRVRIGDADVLLERGVYTYAVTYRTERWMRFGARRDSLAWNVTGNGWGFPIERATARIVLPGPVDPDDLRLVAWTGPAGATEQEARVEVRPEAGVADFAATTRLAPREGLTVEVGLPSGVVAPPSDAQMRTWFWLDWGGYLEAGAASLLVLAWYLLLWVRVGRDPDRDVIMVRYEPPADLSPAALGYIRDRGFGNHLLTASLVNLGVSGAARLERPDEDTWRIEATGAAGVPPLTREEERLLANLTPGGRSLTLTGSTSSRLRSANTTLQQHLEQALEGTYFVLNRRWFVAGLVVSLLAFALLALRYRYDVAPPAWFLGFWLTGWSVGTAALVWQVVRAWRAVFQGRRSALLGAPAITLFATPFVGAEIVVAALLYQMVPGHLVVAAVVIGALNVAFFRLLERPTLRGRGILDHLEGFRRFLDGTEQDRFDRLQDPERPLELFEKYLPHAIALGVENRWAERFDGALHAAGRSGSGGASVAPSWYSGTGAFSSAGGLTRSLGSSLGSTLSSSSAAPSSSGGGGGSSGGSSGGGGGGGGGGGW